MAVSIADTACAKSRPLGAKLYDSLRKLGAATDMPAIEYRQAWALIGSVTQQFKAVRQRGSESANEAGRQAGRKDRQ